MTSITHEHNYILENDAIRAVFKLSTGALLSFTNKKTGWNIQRREELALAFQLQVPLPNMRNNLVLGNKQCVSSYEIAESGKAITFRWNCLDSEYCAALPIALTTNIQLDDDGLTFNAEIQNNSDFVVEAVAYPCLGDLAPATTTGTLERFVQGYGGGGPSSLYPTFQESEGYWGTSSPMQRSSSPGSQFMLVQHDEQGFFVGIEDHQLSQLVNYVFEYKPGFLDYYTFLAPTTSQLPDHDVHLEMRIEHYPFVQPGCRESILPIRFQPYIGKWQQGVDIYKTRRADWFLRPPSTPEWVTEIHSWLQFHMHDPEDTIRAKYVDLPALGRQCAKHGISAIQLVGWNDGGQDRGNPSHNTDNHLGSWQELHDAIAEVQAMGVKMILFTKFTWLDMSTEWFATEGHKHASRDPYGGVHWAGGYKYQSMTQLADINTRRFAVACTSSPEWRQVAMQEFLKPVELGADGMLFDEAQHHGSGQYCFSPEHQHAHPAFLYSDDLLLAREFRAMLSPDKSTYLFSGEALNDYELQEYHLSYFRVSKSNATHMHRYIDPFAPFMVAVRGFDGRNDVNKCLQYRYIISYEPYNFKGWPEDFPLTIEYGKQMDAFRTPLSRLSVGCGISRYRWRQCNISGWQHGRLLTFSKTGKWQTCTGDCQYG